MIRLHDPALLRTALSSLFGEGITLLLATQEIYVIGFIIYTVASSYIR
jgi:hypothetical protein